MSRSDRSVSKDKTIDSWFLSLSLQTPLTQSCSCSCTCSCSWSWSWSWSLSWILHLAIHVNVSAWTGGQFVVQVLCLTFYGPAVRNSLPPALPHTKHVATAVDENSSRWTPSVADVAIPRFRRRLRMSRFTYLLTRESDSWIPSLSKCSKFTHYDSLPCRSPWRRSGITKRTTARAWAVVRISWTLHRRAADQERQTGFVVGQGHAQGHEELGNRVCGVARCDPLRWPSAARVLRPHCPAAADEADAERKAANTRRIPGGLRCSASDARVTAVRRGRPAPHQYELDWRTPPRDRGSHTRRVLSSPPVSVQCNSHNKLASLTSKTTTCQQWRHKGGGPPRVTPSRGWHPKENIFVGEFTKNSAGDKRGRTGKKGAGWHPPGGGGDTRVKSIKMTVMRSKK